MVAATSSPERMKAVKGIIGIEGYQNLPKSDYSYDDAKLVKEYARALGFKERNIELITDERATKTTLEKTLEVWLKNKAKSDSRVLVYYSGHGAPDPATGEASRTKTVTEGLDRHRELYGFGDGWYVFDESARTVARYPRWWP